VYQASRADGYACIGRGAGVGVTWSAGWSTGGSRWHAQGKNRGREGEAASVKWFGSSVNTVGDGGRRLFELRRTLGPGAGSMAATADAGHWRTRCGLLLERSNNSSSGLPVACYSTCRLRARPSSTRRATLERPSSTPRASLCLRPQPQAYRARTNVLALHGSSWGSKRTKTLPRSCIGGPRVVCWCASLPLPLPQYRASRRPACAFCG
jgi:hypothetical protein